jgi:hypothetical protein
VLRLKTAWHDGTTHIVMSPLEFMQRLAALVPRPRLHLIRFHGVLAPNAKLRAQVIPAGPEDGEGTSPSASAEPACAYHRAARLSWARLLKRVFAIDLEQCPYCGGELKIRLLTLPPPRAVALAVCCLRSITSRPRRRVREAGPPKHCQHQF